MKKIFTSKRLFSAALILFMAASQAFGYEIIWVRATAYPTGAGTVYTNWSNKDNTGELPIEKEFAAVSEFKHATNGAISTAYIWSQLEDNSYQLAGYARDTNGNGSFDNDTNTDKQVKVDFDGYFKGVPYPETYDQGSSSVQKEEAEEALNEKTEPSDLVFAVFTKGAVAKMKAGQEDFGHIWNSHLSSVAGDKVQFLAYSDTKEQAYYKFDHWENAAGENIGNDRLLTVTVTGMDVYYAVVSETTKEDYQANEKDPYVEDKQSGQFPWDTGITEMKAKELNSQAYYDLQGRRVAEPTKGIFIQNGKKLIIK